MANSFKTTKQFEEAYRALNQKQRQAVDTIDGPVMVIAGPGTGKTQVLTLRIANILKNTDINPSSILALTFTESAASNMRKRLVSMIGETAYYVRISTFHAFCASVISDNPEEFPLPHESEPLTDLERFEIITQIIRNNELAVLKPINDPMYYAKTIVSHISELKREGISPDRYDRIVDQEGQWLESQKDKMKKTEYRRRERNYFKHKDLAVLYHQYQESLQTAARYDFDDMIALTAHAFSTNEELLASYQERFQYILVDEYQDTNGAQNLVVNLLASFWGERANVFVVGDVNQSIYRFQGASAENVLSFLDTYPSATVITLDTNYRSTQQILDAACELISHNHTGLDSRLGSPTLLKATIPDGEKIQLIHTPTEQAETIYIAEQIQKLLQQGIDPDEIAVMYRNNADSALIADTLARWDIPYEIEGGSNILTTPIIWQLLVLLSVINGIRENREGIDLFTLLQYEWVELDRLTVLQYTRKASTKGISLFDAIMEPTDQPLTQHQQAVRAFIEKLVGFLQQERQRTFVSWFEMVLTESGFLEYALGRPAAVEDLNRVNTLFNEIKKMCAADHACSLKRFLEIIETMNTHGLSILEEDQNIREGTVRLTTAHKAKGQEWRYVFILTAVDGKWGNNKGRRQINMPEGVIKHVKVRDEELQALEDERRLFYVAVTRAKTRITITLPDSIISGARSKETVPSIFVTELGDHGVNYTPEKLTDGNQQELLTKLLTYQPQRDQTPDENAWLSTLLSSFKLSSTALNTYLQCHYKFKLNNLLKVPRAKAEYLSMGSAVHRALELFFLRLKETKQVPPASYLLASYEEALKKEILTKDGYNRRLTQGKKMLSMYYKRYKEEFTDPLYCERNFGSGMSTTQFDGISLQGKVDRIDWIDKEKKTVRIIDYKTGRAKSLNDIEGKTASSDGSYKRQLVFYKLLTQLDSSFPADAVEFEFDFVEADRQSGRHKKVTISVSNEEVQELKNVIRQTMKDIRGLHFERTTDTRICHTCEFNKHCWPEGIPVQRAHEAK